MADAKAKKNFDPVRAMGLKVSPLSLDYVNQRKQFQLHNLVTEQRHPKTWDLSRTANEDTEEALKALLSVDQDISKKFQEIAGKKSLFTRSDINSNCINSYQMTKPLLMPLMGSRRC